MRNILTLTLKTGLLLSLRFLKISRRIRTLHVEIKGSIPKEDVTVISAYMHPTQASRMASGQRTQLPVQGTQEVWG